MDSASAPAYAPLDYKLQSIRLNKYTLSSPNCFQPRIHTDSKFSAQMRFIFSIFIRETGLKFSFFVESLCGFDIHVIVAS